MRSVLYELKRLVGNINNKKPVKRQKTGANSALNSGFTLHASAISQRIHQLH